MADSTTKREGPKLVVLVSITCEGCEHLDSQYYYVEDGNDCARDCGFTHHCKKMNGQSVDHGDSWKTPKWCPFYPTEVPKAQWPT
jgi:hypothetical protein